MKAWSIVLSVLMIIAGLCAIAAPAVAGVTVTAIVGWLLIFSGLLHVAFAWRASGAGAVLWELLVGIVYGVAGVYLISHPLAGLATLALVIAVYLFFEGTLEFILSFRLRHRPRSGWLMLDGIITLVLAFMVWFTWPASALWIVGVLVGISMLFSGITRLIVSTSFTELPA